MNEELIDETESKYTYTRLQPTTRILAMWKQHSNHLDYEQLVPLCKI